jgi:hypothetical protein
MFKQISDLLNGGDNNICNELACVVELVTDICNEVSHICNEVSHICIMKLVIYIMKLVIYAIFPVFIMLEHVDKT